MRLCGCALSLLSTVFEMSVRTCVLCVVPVSLSETVRSVCARCTYLLATVDAVATQHRGGAGRDPDPGQRVGVDLVLLDQTLPLLVLKTQPRRQFSSEASFMQDEPTHTRTYTHAHTHTQLQVFLRRAATQGCDAQKQRYEFEQRRNERHSAPSNKQRMLLVGRSATNSPHDMLA